MEPKLVELTSQQRLIQEKAASLLHSAPVVIMQTSFLIKVARLQQPVELDEELLPYLLRGGQMCSSSRKLIERDGEQEMLPIGQNLSEPVEHSRAEQAPDRKGESSLPGFQIITLPKHFHFKCSLYSNLNNCTLSLGRHLARHPAGSPPAPCSLLRLQCCSACCCVSGASYEADVEPPS